MLRVHLNTAWHAFDALSAKLLLFCLYKEGSNTHHMFGNCTDMTRVFLKLRWPKHVHLQLFDIGVDGGEQETDGEMLAETEEVPYECGPRQKYPMLFEEPVPLQVSGNFNFILS